MNARLVKRRVDLNMLTGIIIFTCSAKVCSSNLDLCVQDNCWIERGASGGGDRFPNTSGSCTCGISFSHIPSTSECNVCQCEWAYTFWSDTNECNKTRTEGCRVRVKDFALSEAATIENLTSKPLQFQQNNNKWVNLNPHWRCSVSNQTYLENDGQWRNLNCVTVSINAMDGQMDIQWSGLNNNNAALDGLLVKLSISCSGGPVRNSCLLFKIIGTHAYDPTTSPGCQDEDTTTEESTSKFSTTPRTTVSETVYQIEYSTVTSVASSTKTRNPSTLVASSQPLSVAAATYLTTLWTSKPRTDENTLPRTDILHTGTGSIATLKTDLTDSLPMKKSPTAAIAGGTAAAVIIFIIAGVALFILWRRKFSPRNVGKPKKNQRVTMSSLQNGHPHPTEGTVDNVIYAGDNAGIVDNLIYEGGMGADGVFSNPGYADKTPQFKPRMDVPGAFVQPNPGATNKTPQPQRNIIIDEPQYAQIVDDQYADPQKVRDNKNKKKAAKDKNYADLHGPQPGTNNSNSNHVYQGLNKGADYQSLRGPREHHEVRPSQVPKTPQDGHNYASLTPGGSKPSAGTLSKEGPDYTVLEGPDSPGEETAAGPDYTTLDGPDSPGDEITSGPDYTVLDGPDSPGD